MSSPRTDDLVCDVQVRTEKVNSYTVLARTLHHWYKERLAKAGIIAQPSCQYSIDRLRNRSDRIADHHHDNG